MQKDKHENNKKEIVKVVKKVGGGDLRLLFTSADHQPTGHIIFTFTKIITSSNFIATRNFQLFGANKFGDFSFEFFLLFVSHITLLPETFDVLLESLFWLRQTSLKISHRRVLTL